MTDAAQQWGGNPDAAARHREHAAERRFLQYDLLFPLFYAGALSRGWIQLASWATSLKLVLIGVAFLLLAVLALWLVMRVVVGRG